jgi:hypothetical protein
MLATIQEREEADKRLAERVGQKEGYLWDWCIGGY